MLSHHPIYSSDIQIWMVGRILAQGYLAYLAGTKEKGLAAALGSLNNSQCISKVFISYQFVSIHITCLESTMKPLCSKHAKTPECTKVNPPNPFPLRFLYFGPGHVVVARSQFSASALALAACRSILRYRNSCREFRLERLIFLEKPIDVFVRLACEHSSGWGGKPNTSGQKYLIS